MNESETMPHVLRLFSVKDENCHEKSRTLWRVITGNPEVTPKCPYCR